MNKAIIIGIIAAVLFGGAGYIVFHKNSSVDMTQNKATAQPAQSLTVSPSSTTAPAPSAASTSTSTPAATAQTTGSQSTSQPTNGSASTTYNPY